MSGPNAMQGTVAEDEAISVMSHEADRDLDDRSHDHDQDQDQDQDDMEQDQEDGTGGSSAEDAGLNGPPASPGAVAGRKRKREKYQKTSCELCKARKVKCDRAEPSCGWCARHNRTCVYIERQKPGSRIGFSLELGAKVDRVDALLQTLWRRVEDHIVNDHGAPVQQHVLSPTAPGNRGSSQVEGFPPSVNGIVASGTSRNHQLPPTQERTPAFSSPSWQGPSDLHDGMRQTGRPSMQALPNLADSFTHSHASPSISGFRRDASLLSANADFPPHDMIYTLVDLYFKHCNTWCPILDRKTTFGIFFGSTSLNEENRVLQHAIIATTLRFMKDPRLSSEMKAHYHAVSKRAVHIYAMEHVTIPALRALVIICLDELGTSNGPRGWNLLSLLAQNVRQLGLCEENSVYLSTDVQDTPRTGSIRRVSTSQPESWIEDEGRRRLCWMVYLLDRYATIATTTFDFVLNDDRMKRVLPCSYDLFSRNVPVETRSLHSTTDSHGASGYAINKPENLGSFSYHCEILRILSRVHDFLKAPIDVTSSTEMASWRNKYRSLDAALDGWLQSLPSEYSKISAMCHSDPASRVANWFMLHSAYVTAVVRLHSSAAYPTVRSRNFVPSHYAMQRCLSAVQSLGDITQDVLEANGLDLVGPPFGFSLWVAARLLLVHAATVGCAVDPKIEFFIDALGHVGQYWEVANNYAKILARVVQRSRQGDMTFGAMRKSAHDLVTLTSATRSSGLEQTSSQSVSLGELDYIDVFDFFNYPKAPEPTSRAAPSGQTNILQSQSMGGSGSESMTSRSGSGSGNGVPDPEADWLGYGSQYS